MLKFCKCAGSSLVHKVFQLLAINFLQFSTSVSELCILIHHSC